MGDINAEGHKGTNAAAGTASTDWVIRSQLDAVSAAISRQPKSSEFWVACVDYDARVLAGNDTTGAFGIATSAGAALTAATATPFKTLEQLGLVMPKIGNDAVGYVLIKGRTGGASYLKSDGVTVQDGAWRDNISGWKRWVSRSTGDFSDTTFDKISGGFVTAPGANSGGYNPTAGATVSTIPCRLNGGGAAGLPLEVGPLNVSSINGYRIRFDPATPTVALRNACSNVWSNSAAQIVVGLDLPATPATNDIFYIETTEFQLGSGSFFVGTNDRVSISGERWTAQTTINGGGGIVSITGCESTTGGVVSQRSFGTISFANVAVDVSGAVYAMGTAGRYSGGMNFGNCYNAAFTNGTVLGSGGAAGCSVAITGTSQFSAFGTASVFTSGLNVANGVGAVNSFNSSGFANLSFGNISQTNVRRLRITANSTIAALYINADGIRGHGVDINNQVNNLIAVGAGSNVALGMRQAYDDIVSTDGGNTGTGLNMFVVHGACVVWGRTFVNTVTTSGAEILMASGTLGVGVPASFAGLASTNYWDPLGNNVIGTAGIVVDKPCKLASNTSGALIPQFSIVRAPGGSLAAVMAQADTAAHASGIVGVAITAPASGTALFLLAPAGTTCPVQFDASLPTAGGVAYLSTGTLGDAQSGLPAASGTNQTLRLGVVFSVVGSRGIVALDPEMVPVLADGAGGTGSIPLGGHAGFTILGKSTAGTGNDADIPVGTDSVTGRIGSGNVGDIAMTAAGRAMAGAASATAQTALLDSVTPTAKGLAPASGGGSTNFLRADGTWAAPPGTAGAAITSLTSDVTATGPGAAAATIANDAVNNAKAANMANGTIKARVTAGTGDPEDATGTQATALLDVFDPTHKGLAPASGGGGANYLRADGTWAAPAGTGGVTSLTGDVTGTGPGATATTIANDAVSFAKMQNIPTQTLVGRQTAATGDPESIGVTGGIEFDGSGNIRRSALTGDVSASAGSAGTVINPNVVTNAQLAQVPTGTLKGRTAAGTGNTSDLTFAAVKAALAIVFADITGTLQAAQFPALTGDVTTVAGSFATTLAASGVTAGTYGDASHVAQVTVDAKGRVTAASSPSISITAGAVSGLSTTQTGPLTGDVTKPAGSGTTTLANIPNDTPTAGDLLGTAIAAPAAPAVGKVRLYPDSTSLTWAAKNNAGVVTHMVKTFPSTTNQVIFAIDDDGTVHGTQIAFSNLSGVIQGTQFSLAANTLVGNNTGVTGPAQNLTPAQVRTMLGIKDTWDLSVSFGIGIGNTTDSQVPNGTFFTSPFWVLPNTKSSDMATASPPYAGTSPPYIDANIANPAAITEFPVCGTFTSATLELYCAAFNITPTSGAAFFTLTMSKNGACDGSPISLSKSSVGANTMGSIVSLGAFSVASGDRVGLRFTSNSGNNNDTVKFTATLRLFN